jgi:hypothetical protein
MVNIDRFENHFICFFWLDPIPEPFVDESAKAAEEDANKDLFDASLPPELRKLMEQARQRDEATAAAAAAAEAQLTKEGSVTDRSGTQVPTDGTQTAKDLTQTSLTEKDDKLFNGKANYIIDQSRHAHD